MFQMRQHVLNSVLSLCGCVCVSVALAVEPVVRKFDRLQLLEAEPTTSASVSVGDINGDGELDILLAKGRHWPEVNKMLLGNGKGVFVTGDIGTEPDRTYSASLADLDGNGSLDLVVSNDRPDRKLVYNNDGKGRFVVSGVFGAPEWPTRYVTLADLNNDGFPDIITANRNGQKARTPIPSFVCFNDGKGGFSQSLSEKGSECRPLPTQSSTIIVAADFDGDGATDLFLPHRDGGHSLIAWNDSKGNFMETKTLGPKESRTRVAAAKDLNGDKLIDLIVGGEEGKGIEVYLNKGNRQFDTPRLLKSTKREAYSVLIEDLNRDGVSDVIVGYNEGKGSVFFGSGSGNDFFETDWNDGVGAVYGLAVGDFDRDGWPDIVSARSGGINAIWYNDPTTDKPVNGKGN